MPVHPNADPHLGGKVHSAGTPLSKAKTVLILLHGRGASASSILELARVLPHPQMAYLAPQAAGQCWWPYRFTEPLEANQPWLDSALGVVDRLVQQVGEAGIPVKYIFLGGFSQGACLAAEYAVRHARRYGGLLVLSGGLVGPAGTLWSYPGSLEGTPALVACSDVDPHIPIWRVHETTQNLSQLGGKVAEKIYPLMGHTIIPDEIELANQLLHSIS